MSQSHKAKTTSYGLVEVRQEGTMYVLYVNGSISMQSADLNYILREFDRR